MGKIDQNVQKLITKTINIHYHVNEHNDIISYEDNIRLSPHTLSNEISLIFDLPKDVSDYIIFDWLLGCGYKNIIDNWSVIYPSNITSPQLSFIYTGTCYTSYIMGVDPASGSDNISTLIYDAESGTYYTNNP